MNEITNMKYTRYEIQERKHSSNVVLGVYEVFNNHTGKYEEHSQIIAIPVERKVEGDKLAVFICDALNSQFMNPEE